jgi:sec-independent protein translocase protein TatA
MGSFSIWHWLVVLGVVVVVFGGGGKISGLMGDFAKGIKSFKKNMGEENDESMAASAEKPAASAEKPTGTITAGTTAPAGQTATSTTHHS